MDLSNENVIHKKTKKIEYLQFRRLLQYPEIKHAYVIGLNKSFKIYSNPKKEEIEKNKIAEESYKEICEELNLKYSWLVNTMQNHTDNIEIINKKVNNEMPDFNIYENIDALITNKKNIILSAINADCILLIFYDPVKKVIANTHSGWKGTIQRISVKTVEMMKREYKCNPEDIICCMSPSIRKDHFEVDQDVYEIFTNEFNELDYEKEKIYKKVNLKSENTQKYLVDTIFINKLILKNIGLKEENIIDSGICSQCNADIIHSYRAHGINAGRATQIIVLEEKNETK